MPQPKYALREECILCCRESEMFGIGQCKHPACMECVIRMRCINDSIVCHACREDVPMMFFVQRPTTKSGETFNWLSYTIPRCETLHPDLQKFRIAFESPSVARAYDLLNAFTCHICLRGSTFAEFPTFAALKQHMGTHRLLYCHICLDNLNILPKNRRTFTSAQLDQHMTGARNVISGVRGHPMCSFCNERFFDDEELYKHSRRVHFFCALCSQETGTNTFFNRIDQLHKHYRKSHHPCLEPDCVTMGIVFVDEFGLKVHKAEQHRGGANRSVPIDYEFTRNSSRYGSPPRRHEAANAAAAAAAISMAVPPPIAQPAAIIPSAQFSGQPVHIVPPANASRRNEADFPSLPPSAAASQAYAAGSANWRANVQASQQRAANANSGGGSGSSGGGSGSSGGNSRPQIGLTNHFPTLGNPGSSRPATSSCAPTNSVWSKSNEKIRNAPDPPGAKKPQPESGAQRRRLIPLPEAWPENMRRKLEARAAGLPEPPDLYPPLPSVPLEIAKRARPLKKKTVNADVVKKKVAARAAPVAQSTAGSAKFGALAAAEAPAADDGPLLADWLSSTAVKAKQKKADKRKAEREAKEAEKARQEEEEQKKASNERLTYAKFCQEREEAERKRLDQQQKEQQEEDYLLAYAYAMENGDSPPDALTLQSCTLNEQS